MKTDRDGGGVRTRDVDAFVRRYAAPLLKAAGYRSRGRSYMRQGPRGAELIVQFDPDVTAHQTGVMVGYGVMTPAFRQYRQARGYPQHAWPHVHESLLHGQLHSPEFARTGAPGAIPLDTWVLGEGEHTALVGDALAGALSDDVVPVLESWLDPATLADAVQHGPSGTFLGMSPERSLAMALLEVDGAEARIREALSPLSPDDKLRVWVEACLAARSTG
ncbi:hypothetical protein [Blastococcus sp. TF02A-35]|uniref:hypothetical protein n=1 Tax=Blastococcus sp. TF02A-35 TaxID=2559612 RepID=UPI00107336E1|nr:hypothetical protein [Blastococcus sp. TF02A_35]TFV48943.1 hypothetical protein E4P43_12775 [Blastococcus sp. TF02A_35]